MSTENEWRPTKKQQSFLSIPLSVKEAFYAGAVGAGKSDVLLLYPIIHRWFEDPEFKGLFLRRTFPELKNEIIPRSQRLFRMVGGVYNKNDKIWEFTKASGLNRSKSPQGAGALFFFGHCENEDDVHNYDSMQPNYAAFDELTSFTLWQYLYIVLERVRRKKNSNLPMIARSGSNPGNTGHNWVRERFIDPCPDGFKLIRNKAGTSRIYIPATIDDNPHIDPEYRKSLEALPEAEKQAKLYGKWDAYEGSVFDEFRDKQYPDEPANALHVIPSFDIPSWWPRFIAGDWGMKAMNWVGHFAVSPNKRLYLYREQTWKGVKIEHWAPYVKAYIDEENPREVVFCRSAGQDRGQETIQEQLERALGVPVGLTNNSPGSRVSGKNILHEYLRWKPKYVPPSEQGIYDEEKARWIFRNRPLSEYEAYMKGFEPPEEESNIPVLQIFEDCNVDGTQPCEVVKALKACIYDKNKVEDVAEFDGDDPYDGLRYACQIAARYFDDSKQEMQLLEQRQRLTDQLEHSQDFTAFYRNASRIEKENDFEIKPVSRYRHH